MRAVEVTRFGGPEVLVPRELPDPAAGPGQVVIAVSVVDTLFVETQIRRGWGGEYFTVQPPYVPGNGVAGYVSSVGEDVGSAWIGRRVVAHTGERGGGGGYAECVVAGVDDLIPVPDEVPLRDAVALLHDGPTALRLADAAKLQPGEWVLVLAAGGGLGILLVQLARAASARVIGAARGEPKLDLARQLGAEVVVDYSQPGWADRVQEATGDKGPGVVFDGVGGDIGRAAFEITAHAGHFSRHGAPSGDFTAIDPDDARRRAITVRGIEDVQTQPAEFQQLVGRVLSEAAQGRVTPVIGQTFTLERAADAHAAIEARRVIGKTLLVV
jgi:NADPH2:quinone reductase